MSPFNDETGGKPKKKRGRPPLTEKQKQQNQAKRDLEKQLQARKKAALKVTTDQHLEATLLEIVNPESRVADDAIQNALVPVQKKAMPGTEPLQLHNHMQDIGADLNQRIQILQNEIVIHKQRLKKLNEICNELLEDRRLSKELIDIEQSVILKNDQLLQASFDPERRPTASYDLPDVVKHVLQFFGWRKDNITLEAKITASEGKIDQRNETLVAINRDLCDYLTVVRYEQDKFQHLDSTKSGYRVLQIKILRDAREMRKFIRQDTISKHQTEVFQKFQESVLQIDKIGQKLNGLMQQTKTNLSQGYKTVKDLQTEAMTFKPGEVLTELSIKIDTEIDNFLQETKTKK
jgi:hypothetical protein